MLHTCPHCHARTITTSTHMQPETDGTHHWHTIQVNVNQACPCPLTEHDITRIEAEAITDQMAPFPDYAPTMGDDTHD